MPRSLCLLGLLLSLCLAGCGSLTRSPDNLSETLTQLQMPSQAELTDVPFFPQKQEQCGPSSLATVLNYRQIDVSAEQLEPLLYIPEKQGTLSIELTAQARAHELLAYPLDKQLLALLQEVAAGNPVLVMQNLGLNWWPQWHFAVAVGYDMNTKTLTLRSGKEPRRQTPFKTFLNTWTRAERWGIVIVEPDNIPASASPTPFLKAAVDLEQQSSEAAKQAFMAALNHWPDSKEAQQLARLGLANIAYSQEQYLQAKNWLADSPTPLSASQWNNLGYVLAALECTEKALEAVQCAQTLQPNSPVFSQSASELSAHKPTSKAGTSEEMRPICSIPQCPVDTTRADTIPAQTTEVSSNEEALNR